MGTMEPQKVPRSRRR